MAKHYVYVLRSLSDSQFYVGLSSDVAARLQQPNDRLVTSTKSGAPFELIYWEGCLTGAMLRNGRNILKAHGVSDTSKQG